MLRLDGERWVKCPVDLEHVDVIDNANEPGQLPPSEAADLTLEFREN